MHVQNFILIAGAETRRTFAKGDEKKYPGNAQPHAEFAWALLLSEAFNLLYMLYISRNGNLLCCIQMQLAIHDLTCTSETLTRNTVLAKESDHLQAVHLTH